MTLHLKNRHHIRSLNICERNQEKVHLHSWRFLQRGLCDESYVALGCLRSVENVLGLSLARMHHF